MKPDAWMSVCERLRYYIAHTLSKINNLISPNK